MFRLWGGALLAIASCSDVTNTGEPEPSTGVDETVFKCNVEPVLARQCGGFYFWLALGLGVLFLGMAVWLALSRSRLSARSMVIASIIYLPLLFLAMLLDRGAA